MLREIKNMSSRAISPDQGENPIMADTEVKRSFVVPAERNSRIPFQSVPIAVA